LAVHKKTAVYMTLCNLVYIYQITELHICQDRNFYIYTIEYLKFHTVILYEKATLSNIDRFDGLRINEIKGARLLISPTLILY
jgi:hypothetical protein